MEPIVLRIVDQQSRVIVDRELSPGWNYLGGPLGAWMFEDGTLRLSAGVYDGDGVGLVFISSLVVNEIEYASGPDVIGRAPFILHGKTWPLTRLYRDGIDDFVIGGVPIPVRQETQPVRREQLGMWEVEGDAVPNDGGLSRIAPVPLCPVDPWASHERTMARTALDCLRASDGMPMHPADVERAGHYSMAGFWGKTTTLPRLVEPETLTPGDDRRRPRRWNQGDCPHVERLFGYRSGTWNGYAPHDGQHRGRTLMPVQILAEVYNDPCAKFDALMLAHDALYAHPTWSLPPERGQGSAFHGRREASWCTMAFRGLPGQAALQDAVRATAARQMPNGGVMRCRQGESESAGFSPDAWVKSAAVPVPLPAGVDAEQSMERWLKDAALATGGAWDAVHASVDRLFEKPSILGRSLPAKLGYVPKWLGVGRKNAGPFRRVAVGAGFADYGPWIALGLAACHRLHEGRYPRRELEWMLQIATPTQGRATTLRDLLARLEREKLGEYQVPAAIHAVRTVLAS